MAAWRTKACEAFGFPPSKYSHRSGVVALFSDLRDMALIAAQSGDESLLRSIFAYSLWADQQSNAPHLRSAADIEFFMRLFDDPLLVVAATRYLPPELVSRKQQLLLGADVPLSLFEENNS